MSDVFISHASEDRSWAMLISEKLQTAGFAVWWDKQIPPGQVYDDVIATQLNAAASVVVLWSKISVQKTWVRDEAERGKNRGVLLPVFLEKVEQPIGFGLIQGIDLSAWQGEDTDPKFASLCSSIQGLVKTPRTPRPAPQPPAMQPVSQQGAAVGPAPSYTAAAGFAPLPPPPAVPVPTPQFFVGRWRNEVGNDVTYFPTGKFLGIVMQNVGGFMMPMNVFGQWSLQILGPGMFQLQLLFATMQGWAGTFQVLDANRVLHLETNTIAFRVG